MDAPALRPLRVGEVLDVAIKVYLRNAWTLFKVVLVVVVPVHVLSVLVFLSATSDPELFEATFGWGSPAYVDPSQAWAFVAGALVTMLLGWLAATLATGACYKTVAGAYLGNPPGWRESLRFAGSRLGALLWVSLLPVLAAALGAAVVLGPGIAFLAVAPDDAGGILLVVVGGIAAVVVGTWVWVRWSVAMPALLTEDVRGRRALGRSFRLVRGRWWPTVGALLLAAIIGSILSGIVSVAAGAVTAVDGGDGVVAMLVADGLARIVSAVIATPLQAAVVTVVYFDLRVRKEGFDLELLTQRLGIPAGPGAAAPPAAPPAAPSTAPPFWPPPPGWKPPEPQ